MATYEGDTSSSAKTNYARLGHASQSLIPKLLQQLLLFYEPTNKILNDCLSNSYLNKKLNANEWINIRKANTDDYVDFDIPLIYKLLRNLKLIPPPTRGWEPRGGPMITETTIGDDLERFRKSRNEILHRGNTNVSDRELTEYFTQFKEIAQRLELALNKKTNELVSEFQNLETCCMDGVSEQILVNLAEKEKEFTLPNKISEYLMSLISNAKSTDSRTLIKKPLQDVCCVEGEIAGLSCEIIEDETAVTWNKDDVEIIPSSDIILKLNGKIHELSIPRTEMKDGGRYSIKVKQSTSEAKLTVKALISNHLVDTTCLEGSTIVLSCEVSVENIDGIWYKDDSIVVKSNQIYPTVNSRIHQLNIFQSEIKDGGKYVFKIRDKISSAILTVKALIKKPLQDVCCVEGEISGLSCEIIEDETAVTWNKDDVEIIPSSDIILKMHGKIHELSIPRTEMKDGGRYSIKVKQSTSEAKLTVKALISNHLVDTTCLEGSTIVLSCEVSVEDIGGIWYKEDFIVVQSSQIYPTVNGRIHQLNIFQSEIKDGGKYVFKIRDKISSAILTVKAVITKHLENVTCIEDQSLSLVCELAEKDISVTWLKDEKDIEASKNIVPEIHNNAHILKFKKLSKNDGGKYALMARGKKTEAVVLVIAKSTIPDQILQMDEKDKEMYLEIIKSGTERRYYIRLMIVGENGVGKTCLMRRLLGENIDDVTSTDGIDVVIRKCKIRLSDGKWILNEDDTVEQDRNVRMKRALTDKDTLLPEAKRRKNRAEPLLQDVPMETTVTPFGNVKDEEIKNVTEIKDIYVGKEMDQKNDVDMQFTNELKESIAESVPLHTVKDVALKSEKRVGLLDTLSDVMNVELPKEFFAECAVWDFAGQKEFYATHQTFLSNSAIYLLTADLSKELSSQRLRKIYDVEFGEVGCYIDFWLDTIHCYATTESDQSVDEPPLDKLEPPIIIVCTGTDKVEGELSEQKSLFEKQLNSILKRQSTRKHIRNIQYLSNKEPSEKDLLELRSAIFETATEMSSWGKELPLRWIHLETALDGERDAGSNILPFHLVVKLAKDSSLPTSDNEEIILFLRYQHECGHVIFFKDLPDYIILNPRWLIDAFKCLVSAHQFQRSLIHLEDWTELEETGRLTIKLITKLFEKVPKQKFMENKEHLLHILEKFDIIVKPNTSNIENMTSYYMPCMIKPSSFNEICDKFGVHTQSCHRTSWLLLEFEFLPPAFFNHVLVGYIRKFKVSIESTENGERLSLYRGIGVFDIDKSGCRKLVICADKNLIAFQIWMYGNVLLHSTFHDIRHTLTNMVDMLSERYQICCKYKVKLKCSESDYQKAEGRFEYKDLQDDKIYFCPEHLREHECLDVYKYWFSDKDVDLFTVCYEKENHCHKMDKLGPDLNDGSSPNDKQDDPQQSNRQSIQCLVHACQCRDANCRFPGCQKMKRVVSHTKCCRKKANGVCPICKQLKALCLYHAKLCTEIKCQVPFCLQIKHKIRQQQLRHGLQQAQMLRRRMASQSTPTTSAQTTSQQSPAVTGIQQQPIPSNFNSEKPVSGPPAAALQAAMAAQQEASRQASLQAGAASVASMPPPPVQAPTQKVPMNSAMNKGGWPQNSTYPTMQQNPMNTGMQMQPQAQPQVVGVRPGMPNAGPQRPSQHMPGLEQLIRTLKSPNSPQQQQKVLQILKSYPNLMAAFIKHRIQQQARGSNP